MFDFFAGAAGDFFRFYLDLLKEGRISDAVSCWDSSAVSSKFSLFPVLIVGALFVISFVLSWRGVFLVAFLKRILDNGKLFLIFFLSVLIFAAALRFSLVYGTLRFMATSDRAVLTRGVKIISEEDRGDVVAVRYVVGGSGVYEAVLKKDGDSFKILQSKRFVGRYRGGAETSVEER
ncbi:hypothetical protein [Desulfurobacterium sp.]